ncbi:MAG: DNA polymerase III subunit alpha, partial [Lachnospiraceae bacterium]|nr:DNA polymerase III subunit alpha [Lachnospiraceae bacterium]
LLKMDFLGLRTLTVIKDAIDLIEKSTGKRIDIDNIDYADQEVLALIGSGKTEGIFQLESAGMKSFMKELKPQSLEDVTAGISLYRPGPMDFIPKYIKGKQNQDNISYLTPELRPILEPTYGCIVYQEQVMQIVRDLGGYTLGRSDLVRRAMSKKKQHVMEVERANFVSGNAEEGVPGCKAKGISEEIAGQIYDLMMDFAKYAFNKSHAACYAVVSYQTAFLKRYYPVEFMAALMTSFIENSSKVSEYINVCKGMNIDIVAPDVNTGDVSFSVVDGKIGYALTAIKNVGYPVIAALVKERDERGPYLNITDFVTRMSGHDLNKRAVENFIKAGAFDSFGGTRKQYMSVYVRIMDSIASDKKNVMAGQISLFDFANDDAKDDFKETLPDVGEYNKDTKLAFEKEVLGIYVSGHPLEDFRGLWQKNITANAGDFVLDPETDTVKIGDGVKATIGGMITAKTVKYTKNNKAMAFITVEDLIGSVEVIVFPKDYEKYQNLLKEDEKVFVEGRTSVEEDKDGKLILERIRSFDDIARKLWIQFDSLDSYKERQDELFKVLETSDGKDHVIIYLVKEKQMKDLAPR